MLWATFAGQDLACLGCYREGNSAVGNKRAETAGGCSHAAQRSQPEGRLLSLSPWKPSHHSLLYVGSPVQQGHWPEQKAGLGPRTVVRMVTREPEAKNLPAHLSSEQLPSVLPGVQEAVVWFLNKSRCAIPSYPPCPHVDACMCLLTAFKISCVFAKRI